MPQIAAIGSKETVLAFGALGLTVVPVYTAEEASRAVFDLASQGYAVLFITEEWAQRIEETISRYKTQALPAIIPIPAASGATGAGMKQVRANVEKAIGADILFKEEG
ncbi:MAG: V-type ATP synthase subunit F [Clostridia bacterium]|nr:V-type ATP synthase subunit F [Clostridia bacterium]